MGTETQFEGRICILPKLTKKLLKQLEDEVSNDFEIDEDEKRDPHDEDCKEIKATAITLRSYYYYWEKLQDLINLISIQQNIECILESISWRCESYEYDFGIMYFEPGYSRTNEWDVIVKPGWVFEISKHYLFCEEYWLLSSPLPRPQIFGILHGHGKSNFVVMEAAMKAIMPYDVVPSFTFNVHSSYNSPFKEMTCADRNGLFPVELVSEISGARTYCVTSRTSFAVPSLMDLCCNVITQNFCKPFENSYLKFDIPEDLNQKLNQGRICTGCGIRFFGKSAILIPFNGQREYDSSYAWGRYCSVSCIPKYARSQAATQFDTFQFLLK